MRTPNRDELHKILELVSFYQDERGKPMDDFNVLAFKRMLKLAQDPNSGIYGAVTEDNGRFTGLIVGMIGPAWFSTTTLAHIGTLYVHPDYRGGSAALKLIRGFERWAKNHHIESIRFEVDSEIEADRVYKFVERLGYRETGRIFEKEV